MKERRGGVPPKARQTREVLSKTEWTRVEEQARQSERSPDPAQLSWLPASEAETSDE